MRGTALAALVIAVVALAGCSHDPAGDGPPANGGATTAAGPGGAGPGGGAPGGGTSGGGVAGGGPGGTGAATSLRVTVATAPGGVQYLADASGRALYLSMRDTAGRSLCNGTCSAAWPPLSGSAAAGTGLTGPLTTITRDDGTTQATYNGHPLYYSTKDAGSGDTRGQAVTANGGLWYLIGPNGSAVTSLAPVGGAGGGS